MMENPPDHLMAGITSEMNIIPGTHENVLLMPTRALLDQFTIDRLDIGEKPIDWRTDLGALHLGLELFTRVLEGIEITIAVDSLRLHSAAQSVRFALRLLVFDRRHVP